MNATQTMSTTIVNLKQKINKTSPFVKAKGNALETAVNNSTASRAKICADGGLSTATMKKALDGRRIIISMANAIVKGLNTHGAKTTREELFESAD